jgi:hypothetical protein
MYPAQTKHSNRLSLDCKRIYLVDSNTVKIQNQMLLLQLII